MPEIRRFLGIVVAGLVIEWATLRRQELLEGWERARANAALLKIAPLG